MPSVVAMMHDRISFGIVKATHSQVSCPMELSAFTVLGKRSRYANDIYRYQVDLPFAPYLSHVIRYSHILYYSFLHLSPPHRLHYLESSYGPKSIPILIERMMTISLRIAHRLRSVIFLSHLFALITSRKLDHKGWAS